MKTIDEFLAEIENVDHRNKLNEVLTWVINTYPKLETDVKWNQPMFIDHGTFIIAFSVAKNNFAIAPEVATMDFFREDIKESGYSSTNNIIRIKWDEPVNYDLLKKLIDFNIADKADYTTFWR